jgi:hypothetical protein
MGMKLLKLAVGKIGETLVELELERRGWMVFIPHYEEGIDLVAAKRVDNEFKYVGIQVKSSMPVHLKGKAYGAAIKRSKLIEASSFFYIWCLMDSDKSTFIVVPSKDMKEMIIETGKTHVKDTCHFHIDIETLGRWAKYKDRFDLLEEV